MEAPGKLRAIGNFFHPEPTKDDFFKPPVTKNNFFAADEPDEEQSRKEALEMQAGSLAFRAVEDARMELAEKAQREDMHQKLAEETLKLIRDFMNIQKSGDPN